MLEKKLDWSAPLVIVLRVKFVIRNKSINKIASYGPDRQSLTPCSDVGLFPLSSSLHSGNIWGIFLLLANGYHELFSGKNIDLSLFSFDLIYRITPFNGKLYCILNYFRKIISLISKFIKVRMR